MPDDQCHRTFVVGAARLGKTLAIHQNIVTNRLARAVGLEIGRGNRG